MTYKIVIKHSAQKDLDKLSDNELKRIVARLEKLRINPRPVGWCTKLSD
ncbi:MAG: hypothetical protein IIB07_07955 [Bacteroidetes bacterium]|nr:hypothetical protein [Bacteroidota bacterium]MCH8171045.1 hypothetical protein [Bacteroidota bacterium]MCH8942711.1 hypothetical protein [Bacteroidota bacterium]